MASTAKSGIPAISSNVKMRIQKWVGRAATVGKQRPERDQRMRFEPSVYDTTRSEMANSTKGSPPIPVSKSAKNYSSRGNNTSVSYPASLLHLEPEETAYYKRDIPSSINDGTRVYGSTGNLTSAHLDRELENTSKRRNQWSRFLGKDGLNKKQKARSTDDLSSNEPQTDTKYHNEGIHNKRAVFKANKLKRSRQTSIDSIEALSSDSSERQNTSFATSVEEPDEEEEFSRGSVEKLSEQINARLQKWVYLAQEKRERRHSEESSGSSSDCTDGSPSTQAKEIRELESALKELVGNATSNARTRRLSRCDLLDGANSTGQRSRKSSRQENYTAPDITLLGRASTSAEPGETEAECLQTKEAEERQQNINALTGKQEGGDGEASSAIQDQERSAEHAKNEVTKASYKQHARHEKVCSSDSGLSLEMDISAEEKQNYAGKNYLSPQTSNSSNGGNTSGLRDVNVICKDSPNIATSDKSSDPRNGNLEMTRNPQEVETCQPSDLSDDKRSKDTNEQPSSPSGASKVRFEIWGESYPRTRSQSSDQSSKTGEIQSILENANKCFPPVGGRKIETPRRPCIMKRRSVPNAVYSLKMRTDVRESMRQFLNFNDVGLSEFAVKCVRHANKKKQRVRRMNSAGIEESCSGSDDNANDKTVATSGEPGVLSNLSQSPLSDRPAIKLGDREFAKTAEEAEMILATSEMCSTGNALPTCKVDAPRLQRLYKFPSLPMFYCPDGINEDAEKRQPIPSLYADNPDLKKCRSTTNLHQEGDINASASKTRARHSITPPNLQDPFFHGDHAPQTDKSDKAGKQKRYNLLRPRSWLSKLKDENGNIQKGEKKLPLKTNSKEQINVSMEALI